MAFLDQSRVLVEPDAEYEAWELVGSNGLQVVCIPGGQLSIWQQRFSIDDFSIHTAYPWVQSKIVNPLTFPDFDAIMSPLNCSVSRNTINYQ